MSFISKSGWIVSTGHAFNLHQTDAPTSVVFRGLPQQLVTTEVHESIRAYEPSIDLLLANVQGLDPTSTNLQQAYLTLRVAAATDKPVIHVQWYDEIQNKQSEYVPIKCESALVHVVVIREDEAYAMRVSFITVDTIKVNQDRDKTLQLSNYISVDIPGGTLAPGDSGSPLVLTTGSGQHVVLGFLRGVFKAPLIGAGESSSMFSIGF